MMNRTRLYKLVQNGRNNPDILAVEIYKRVLQRKMRQTRNLSITTSYKEIMAQFCNYYEQTTIRNKLARLKDIGLISYSVQTSGSDRDSIIQIKLLKDKLPKEGL